MLLYFSAWLSPAAASGCRRGDNTWVLPHVEMFGVSILTLHVNGDLPIAAWDRDPDGEGGRRASSTKGMFEGCCEGTDPSCLSQGISSICALIF